MLRNVGIQLAATRTMSTATAKPAIRPSATLIIAAPKPADNLGSGSNYRVLMVKRNARSSFINAHVYPGGVLDNHDGYAHWKDVLTEKTEAGQAILANKICAIRETFEESGLLLTSPPAHEIKALDINHWRKQVHDDASQFRVMCDKFKILPAVDKLVPFSNWITPVHEKKRYNTVFFLTILDQFKTQVEHDNHLKLVAADGKETVLFDWYEPEKALKGCEEKQLVLFPPQWYSLAIFSEFPNYGDLIKNAGVNIFKSVQGEIAQILPQFNPLEENEYTGYLAYPGDECYKDPRYTIKAGNRHRLYFKGRMQDFKLERNVDMTEVLNNKKSHL